MGGIEREERNPSLLVMGRIANAIWQTKSFIKLLTGFTDVDGSSPIDDAATQCFDSYKAANVKSVASWGNIT
jgi:hypothetical protein